MTEFSNLLFNEKKVLAVMETMRRPNGAFIASTTPDYGAMWIRDTLYCTFSYWYLGDYDKLRKGVWVIFDLFKKYRRGIRSRIASPIEIPGGIIHAKFDADTLEKICDDDSWAHHQLDAIGLFLYVVADLDFKNLRVIRNNEDLDILQDIIAYLRSVEYWHRPDFGMWEECKIKHSSSIGAVVGGLSYIKKQRLAIVPDSLVESGQKTLHQILPFESRDNCGRPHHNHDCDAAQLSLIWPYHVVFKPIDSDELLERIIGGHTVKGAEKHRLLQSHGINRYWGDDYYRSNEGEYRGISAEWPMFKFWVSIIYSQLHDYEKAKYWFGEGCKEVIDNQIPEAYQNGKATNHTPLAWAHALALIAWSKLPQEIKSPASQKIQKTAP